MGDDLVSFLIRARQPDGEPFSDHQVLGALRLLLVAGIDTTWSAIGIGDLASGDPCRTTARLVSEPELIPTAIEELLRAYAPVTMAREIVDDVTVGSCPMKRGEMVLLSFPAANRDPGKFPDADKVVIDRKENPHVAFGLGIHRCIGSNLARMEMRVARGRMAAADSRVSPRSSPADDLVAGNGARPAPAADRAWLDRSTAKNGVSDVISSSAATIS